MKTIFALFITATTLTTIYAMADFRTLGVKDVSSIQSRPDGLFNVICKDGRYQEGVSEDDLLQNRVCSGAAQVTKLDVMFVIDNSGSMYSAQSNLAKNFPAIIETFLKKNLDFQIAVTTTDAYLALPAWTPYYNQIPTPGYYEERPQEEKAWFRAGTPNQPSPYRILNSGSQNLLQNFILNATQGTYGRGDERSLQSLRAALVSPGNSGFLRADAYLAIVILTDEDDFSHDGIEPFERYDRPLHTIDSYIQFLDTLTSSSAGDRRYSVSTISVNSLECLNAIYNGAQKMGIRVGQLADATGGIKGNICGDFANELDGIFKNVTRRASLLIPSITTRIVHRDRLFIKEVGRPQ